MRKIAAELGIGTSTVQRARIARSTSASNLGRSADLALDRGRQRPPCFHRRRRLC